MVVGTQRTPYAPGFWVWWRWSRGVGAVQRLEGAAEGCGLGESPGCGDGADGPGVEAGVGQVAVDVSAAAYAVGDGGPLELVEVADGDLVGGDGGRCEAGISEVLLDECVDPGAQDGVLCFGRRRSSVRVAWAGTALSRSRMTPARQGASCSSHWGAWFVRSVR